MTTYVYSNQLLSSSTIINLNIQNKKDKYNNILAYIIPINSFNIDYESSKFNNIHKQILHHHPLGVFLPHLQHFVIWYLDGSNFPIDPVKLQQLLSVTFSLIFRINPTPKTPKRIKKIPTLEMCIKSMLTTILGFSFPQLIPLFIKLIYQIPHMVIDIKTENSMRTPHPMLESERILFSPYQLFEAYDLRINQKTQQQSQEKELEEKA